MEKEETATITKFNTSINMTTSPPAPTLDPNDLIVVPYYTFCLEDTSTLNNPIVGEQCEQVFPEHNIGYCNRNFYDCMGDDYIMPSRYDNGTWYYPPPTDNDFPPAPNTYGQRVFENGDILKDCYDFALKRTIDNDYCEDIGEDNTDPPAEENLTEWGFAYCPPRVACVDDIIMEEPIDVVEENKSTNSNIVVPMQSVDPITPPLITKEEEEKEESTDTAAAAAAAKEEE
jgi:hypothetical protein